jgi:hypothetical protein
MAACVTLSCLHTRIVMVSLIEHVVYEGAASSDSIEDDVLGVSYKVQRSEKVEAKPAEQEVTKAAPEPVDDLDEQLPF